MRRVLVTIYVLISVCVTSIMAETVTQKEAKQYAREFYNQLTGEFIGQPDYVYNGKRLTTDRLFTPFYVFNYPAGGYVIISGDNKAMPVLAYSPKGRFNEKEIPDETLALLQEYAEDIERIRYDSRIPFDAIEAWTGFSDYAKQLIMGKIADFGEQFMHIGDSRDIYRRHATEYTDLRPLFTDADVLAEDTAEEDDYVPFAYYNEIKTGVEEEQKQRELSLQESLHPSTPIVRYNGSGRYSVSLPAEPVMALVYNIAGALVRVHKYHDNPIAYIDILSEPHGFYFAEIIDEGGNRYGVKLIR